MQVLYALNRDSNLTLKDAVSRYNQSVQKSYEIYLFNILQLYKIAAQALKELEKRQSKLLPSDEDKNFTPKLWTNPVVQSLQKNMELEKVWKQRGLTSRIDADSTRLFYNEFSKSDEYLTYIKKADSNEQDDRDVLLDLFKVCMKNEAYNDFMESIFPSWYDDESLLIGAVKKTIKALPSDGKFFEEYLPEEEATKEFGEELLKITFMKDAELLALIEPTLQNWDVERVAILDMIMLKMAVCELVYFPTIPTKVTLNEFVEIAKLYSTDKSKDFINGILDRLMKQLDKDGKIKKEGRGLLE